MLPGSGKRRSNRRRSNRVIFETELKVQEGNITEAGEKEFTEQLRAAWNEYQAKFERLKNTASAEEAKQIYFSELENAFYEVKTAADQILGDQSGCDGAKERRRCAERAERMNTITITVALAALVLGLFISIFVDAPHIAAAVGVERGDPSIWAKGNFDTRAKFTAMTSWRIWRMISTPWRRGLRNTARVRSASCCKRISACRRPSIVLPDPVVIFSVAGDIQNVNHAARDAARAPFGRSQGSAEGDRCRRYGLFSSACAVTFSAERALTSREGFEDAVQLPTMLGRSLFLTACHAGV